MNDFKYNPIDYDEPVRTDMINVYESVKKHDKFAYMYHVGNLFYSLKNLGTFNVIPMATIKEMQYYFGGLYD